MVRCWKLGKKGGTRQKRESRFLCGNCGKCFLIRLPTAVDSGDACSKMVTIVAQNRDVKCRNF